MAVTSTPSSGVIKMTAAGDEVLLNIHLTSISVVSAAGLVDDVVLLVDPADTALEIEKTIVAGADYVERNPKKKQCANGVRLHINTGDRAEVYLHYE